MSYAPDVRRWSLFGGWEKKTLPDGREVWRQERPGQPIRGLLGIDAMGPVRSGLGTNAGQEPTSEPPVPTEAPLALGHPATSSTENKQGQGKPRRAELLPPEQPLPHNEGVTQENGEIVITAPRESTRSAERRGGAWRPGGRMSPEQVERRAEHAMRIYGLHRERGMSPEQAAGWAANAEGESASDYRSVQRPGPGRGLYQWGATNPRFDRRRDFRRIFGHPIEQSTEAEQLAFRDWELRNTEIRASRHIAGARTGGDVAAAITTYYERPAEPDRDAADRANIAEAILRRAQRR